MEKPGIARFPHKKAEDAGKSLRPLAEISNFSM